MRCTLRGLAVGVLMSGLWLTGCTGQRSLLVVREQGDAAYEAGDYEKALADYREYVERKPWDAAGRYNLGRTLLTLGRTEESVKHFQVAYDIDPERDIYVESLAEALLQDGQLAQMYDLLRGLARDRGLVTDHVRLGRFTARAGDPDEALRSFLTAVDLDQGRTVEPQLELAKFYLQIDDRENTLRRLRMALYLDPANQEVNTLIRHLGEIPGPTYGLPPTGSQ